MNTDLSASRKKLLEDALKDRETRYVATGQSGRRTAGRVIDHTLTQVHQPDSLETYREAMERVRRIAAVCVIADAVRQGLADRADRLDRVANIQAPKLCADDADLEAAIDRYAVNLPFTLTAEQRTAAREILADLNSGQPMRRVLSGDVGTGKTAVYAVGVAAMIAAGHRVAVILPSSLLATQVAEKMAAFVPGARVTLVTGNQRGNPAANLWVGTVGINHQAPYEFEAVVVDEQQKFTRHQREDSAAEGAHLLEVTATCIARTQTLLNADVLDVSRLRTGHVGKRLRTRIWEPDHRAALYRAISADVTAAHIVMVIYHGKEVCTDESAPVYSVKGFLPIWERQFPGKIAVCHGGQSAQENDAAVAAVKSGDKAILLATSIVEVGIDIAGVKRVVVVQPERFGLATLHQLRGRAAREGGEGYCDLVLANKITARAHARLEFLSKHSDGFKLAEYDLDDRGGGGDTVVDGHRQTGQMPKSPFTGYEPPQDLVAGIAAELSAVYRHGIPTPDSDSAPPAEAAEDT